MEAPTFEYPGQWRYTSPTEANTVWRNGRMVLQPDHLHKNVWDINLRLNVNPKYNKNFRIMSPACITFVSVHTGVLMVNFSENISVFLKGLPDAKLEEAALVFRSIQAGEIPQPNSSVKEEDTSEDEARKYSFFDDDRSKNCLMGLFDLYKNGELCDVTLAVGSTELHCHRVVLAASSPYFSAMFAGNFMEKTTSRVVLNEIDVITLQLILKYLYTGCITMDGDTVQGLFNAAHMFQLEYLEDTCATYMRDQITDKNCIGVYFFAKNYNKTQLQKAARHRICNRFVKVSKSPEFLELTGEQVAELLESGDIVNVIENDIYMAGVRWLEYDVMPRIPHMYRVMKTIRFVHMAESYFRERVKNKALFRYCPALQALFEQVIYQHNHPYRSHELDLNIEPRRCDRDMFPRPIIYTVTNTEGGSRLCGYLAHPYSKGPFGSTQPLMPTENCKNPSMAVTEDGTEVYLAGGTGRDNNKVFRLITTCRTFSSCSPMISPRSHFNLINVDRFLYAVGGKHKDSCADTVEKYSNQWMKVAPIPCRLSCMCSTSLRGRLYVFGGETQVKKKTPKAISSLAFCYDPETDRWSTIQPMSQGRALAACAIYQGKIYVIGGVSEITEDWLKFEKTCNELSTCEIYDTATNTWSLGPTLPKPLCAMGAVRYHGTIYLLGGLSNGEESRDVYYLSECGDQWLTAPQKLSHSTKCRVTIHSQYKAAQFYHMTNSDSDSESTPRYHRGYDTDSTSASSPSMAYQDASWDTDSSESTAYGSRNMSPSLNRYAIDFA